MTKSDALTSNTYIYGAAHQWASLQCILHDLVELCGIIRQFKVLGNSTCEILHGFQSVPSFQCLIRPVQPEREVDHSGQCADMCVLRGWYFSHSWLSIREIWGRSRCVTNQCESTLQKYIRLSNTVHNWLLNRSLRLRFVVQTKTFIEKPQFALKTPETVQWQTFFQ